MRKILHVDMDAFFASVEQREHPEWRGKPVIVGGSVRERGVVATCSYEARAFGVRSAMPMSQAVRLCPKGIVVPPNFPLYREICEQVRGIFRRYTPLVEPMSIDEAYLDVTENSIGEMSATLVARRIQQDIYEETGLTCSVGVSFNKFLAKIASGYKKPAAITVIDEVVFPEFIKTLPIEDFFGVGKVTAEKLKKAGLHNGADVLNQSQEWLVQRFGKQGEALYRQVRGQSNDQLTLERVRKSIGKEVTLMEDTNDEMVLEEHLKTFAKKITKKLQQQKMAAKTVTLKLRYETFEVNTRSRTLPEYFNDAATLQQAAVQLFRETFEDEMIRLIGLSVSQLEETANIYQQLKLF